MAWNDEPHQRLNNYKDLISLYKQRALDLCSYQVIVKNGTIQVSTRSGATLTSENVINALLEKETQRQENQRPREFAEQQREEWALVHEQRVQATVQHREERIVRASVREEVELQRIRARRECRRSRINETRNKRRPKARLRLEEQHRQGSVVTNQ